MIHLTRLNSSSLIVNSDLIKFVEQSPDTVITLLNGEKVIVREGAEKVLERIIEFRRAVLQGSYAAGALFTAIPVTVPHKTQDSDDQAER